MIHSSRRPRSVLTPDLAERLKTHKADLLTILRPAGALGDDDLAPAVDAITTPENQAKVATGLNGWDDAIEPPAPCPACGGLMFWWNPLGVIAPRLRSGCWRRPNGYAGGVVSPARPVRRKCWRT